MFIQAIKYQIVEKGEWFNGWYIGECENSSKSVILDENFNQLEKDYNGFSVWDYKDDVENYLKIDIPFERK